MGCEMPLALVRQVGLQALVSVCGQAPRTCIAGRRDEPGGGGGGLRPLREGKGRKADADADVGADVYFGSK